MTNEELTTAINDAIDDCSDSLRGLLEEAARRLQEGRAADALKESFRYGARIFAFIERKRPKGKGERMSGEGAVLPVQTTIFPTEPGAYWYQPVGLAHVLLVDVRLTEGELTVWWADRPIAIAKLAGYWRGPLKPFTGPLNE